MKKCVICLYLSQNICACCRSDSSEGMEDYYKSSTREIIKTLGTRANNSLNNTACQSMMKMQIKNSRVAFQMFVRFCVFALSPFINTMMRWFSYRKNYVEKIVSRHRQHLRASIILKCYENFSQFTLMQSIITLRTFSSGSMTCFSVPSQ